MRLGSGEGGVELPDDASGACAHSPWLTPPHYQDLPYIYFLIKSRVGQNFAGFCWA